MRGGYDAVVVGAGPNGLAAAITVAEAGRSVLVLEAADTPGGGCRSARLTLDGFVHDVCSAIHPWPVASPLLSRLGLERYGLEMVHPPAPLAHPLDDGSAVMLERSVDETARGLGGDARAYRSLFGPLVAEADRLLPEILAPFHLPRHPLLLARFGLAAIRSAVGLARSRFRDVRARALFGGLAAHSMLSLTTAVSAAFGLSLALVAHAYGWPLVRGGSQRIVDALVAHLGSLGGEIVTGKRVGSLDELPPARAILCDLTPRQLVRIAGRRVSAGDRRALERYRYGPGVFKVDWALDGPIPWRAAECARAATVHLGGTLEELAASEAAATSGRHAERPFVLLAQQSLFDPTRAPVGKHTAWAYCHAPNGSTEDMTERIERQVERFAPGFRDRILARHTMNSTEMERYNENYVGGDINGGVQDLFQHFTRPTPRLVPYATSIPNVYLCSSSTPPGGGVHGMCGYHAGRAALARSLRGG